MFSPGPERQRCDGSLSEQVTANDMLAKQQEERMAIISPFVSFPREVCGFQMQLSTFQKRKHSKSGPQSTPLESLPVPQTTCRTLNEGSSLEGSASGLNGKLTYMEP